MLDALLAGAASALIGTALGFRLKAVGGADWMPPIQQLESQVATLTAKTNDLASQGGLKLAIKEAQSECHARAANIANEASVEVMEQMLLQLQNSLADCKSELQGEITAAIRGLNEELRVVFSAEIVSATADLITRGEVQNAFAQVAQIEAARLQEQQDASARAAAQQARIQEVFGTTRPLVNGLDQQLGELNAQLEGQLGALQQRLSQIRGGGPVFGVTPGVRPLAVPPEAALVDPGVN